MKRSTTTTATTTSTTSVAVATLLAVIVAIDVVAPCRAWVHPPARVVNRHPPHATSLRQSGTGRNEKNDGSVNGNNNVVFRPSADPNAFDSYKIGSARVHRYSEVGSDAAYVMWYHGRDADLDASPPHPLPPLSTGRVGRATSRNGLLWRRDDEGSVDSDKSGTSLGLNVESWYGFDTSHLGLGQVLLPMTSPSIRSEGGVYVMYYMGGNHELSDLVSYLPGANVDEDDDDGRTRLVPPDAKLRGMKLRIGAAISQDGITWGRIEGDDPSGACMVPYDTEDINNVDVSVAMDDRTGRRYVIDEELYCGWPEVIVNPVGPNENNKKGSGASTDPKRNNFYMYYSTMLKGSRAKTIAAAVSNNGFAWSKMGEIKFVDGPSSSSYSSSFDGGGRARCNVVRRSILNEDGLWDEDESRVASWMMFYEGVSIEDGRHRILAAESDDLRVWRKLGLALDVGRTGGVEGADGDDNDNGDYDAWDSRGVGSPHVIRLDDGFFRMYYTGEGSDGRTAIGVARSVDMITWERERVVELSSLLNI